MLRRIVRNRTRAAVALTAAAVLYGNLVNLLPQGFHTAAYVPLNLAVGALAGVVAWRLFGLSFTEMGQDRRAVKRSIVVGGGIGLAIVAPVYIALFVPGLRELMADDTRHADLPMAGFLYTVLIRIPIGTALFEEWLFRGVLFAVWLRVAGLRAAFVVPSIAFGLWHIIPTMQLVAVARPEASFALAGGVVLGGVVATFIAGILFTLLRQDGRGVLAPTITHALINSLALIASELARG